MEPGGSMPHSQGFSNNPYREPNQPNSMEHIYKYKRCFYSVQKEI